MPHSVKLKESVVAHTFSDDSGLLIYNTTTDESVLLPCDRVALIQSYPSDIFVICNSDELRDELKKKGMAFEA
ncbi:hypothetical protein MTsDn1_22040 [Alteromonas sp. MTD1]